MNELIVIEKVNKVELFNDKNIDPLLEEFRLKVRAHKYDLTTAKGRKEIGALAGKVSTSKKMLEKCAKELVKDSKAKTKIVDDCRIKLCKEMDELRIEARKPLSDWEKAEKDRVDNHEGFISGLIENLEYTSDMESYRLEKEIDHVEKNWVINNSLEEFEEEAHYAKLKVITHLKECLEKSKKREEDQAELERLKKAEADRIQKESEDKAAQEQKEREAKIAKEAQEKAEKDQAEKLKRVEEEKEAALRKVKEAEIESERREKDAKIKAEKDKQEAIEKVKKEAEEKERARINEQARIDRIAQEEADKIAKMEEARKVDVEHRTKINNTMADSLCGLGCDKDLAIKIIKSVVKGEILNISINY